MTAPNPFQSIAIRADKRIRSLHIGLARILRDEHDATIHIYCALPQDVKDYQQHNQDGLFASVTHADTMYSRALNATGIPNQVLKQAREWEERLNLPLNRLIMTDRHLGRSFSLGGFHHPRSVFSEQTNYIQTIEGVCSSLDFWQREAEQKGFSLMLNATKVTASIAALNNFPIRSLLTSGIDDYYFWAIDEYGYNPAFEERFNKIQSAPAVERIETYRMAEFERHTFLNRAGYMSMAYRLTRRVAKNFYRRMLGGTGYYLREELKYEYRLALVGRQIKRRGYTPLDTLRGTPFVYFPLQEEPEVILTVGSPEYTYQLGAISSLARDLPAGVLLAVKETPYAFGRRSSDFYDQICEFKNVVWLDVNEPGVNVIREASAVATISGTGGFEGALIGKPIISFGRHNYWNFIPHVSVVTDEAQIASLLTSALAAPRPREEDVANGARARQAVIDCSFDLGLDYADTTRYDPQALRNLYTALAQSFNNKSEQSSIVTPQ